MDTIVNDAMINRLVQGEAQGVRALRQIGLSLPWCIDRVVDLEGNPVAIEPDAPLSSEHRVERFSMWHWSHRASQAGGVQEWWASLDAMLAQAQPAKQAPMLAQRLEEAIEASALSGQTAPAIYTWVRALGKQLPRWERSVMVHQLLNVMERQGNLVSPLLQRMHLDDLLTPQDWSVESRKRYASDPVGSLYDNRAWDALWVLLKHGASPSRLSGISLLDQTVARVRMGLQGGENPDGSAIRLLGQMLDLHSEALPVELQSDLDKIVRALPDEELAAELKAQVRAHQAHQGPVNASTIPSERPIGRRVRSRT